MRFHFNLEPGGDKGNQFHDPDRIDDTVLQQRSIIIELPAHLSEKMIGLQILPKLLSNIHKHPKIALPD